MSTKSEPKIIEHADPEKTSLPSAHIDHSAVFVNEIANRIAGFDNGIAALVADMDGLQTAYERDCANLAAKHAEVIEARHRLKRDLERGRRMALAAQAAYSEEIPADIDLNHDNVEAAE